MHLEIGLIFFFKSSFQISKVFLIAFNLKYLYRNEKFVKLRGKLPIHKNNGPKLYFYYFERTFNFKLLFLILFQLFASEITMLQTLIEDHDQDKKQWWSVLIFFQNFYTFWDKFCHWNCPWKTDLVLYHLLVNLPHFSFWCSLFVYNNMRIVWQRKTKENY